MPPSGKHGSIIDRNYPPIGSRRLPTFIVADEAGSVAEVFVTFHDLFVSIVVTF